MVNNSIKVSEDLENDAQIPKLNLYELVTPKHWNFM